MLSSELILIHTYLPNLPVPERRIELIAAASVGLVWSGQHLAHNAQRQNAPAHSTHYPTITIEGKTFSVVILSFASKSE